MPDVPNVPYEKDLIGARDPKDKGLQFTEDGKRVIIPLTQKQIDDLFAFGNAKAPTQPTKGTPTEEKKD